MREECVNEREKGRGSEGGWISRRGGKGRKSTKLEMEMRMGNEGKRQ